jgi:transcriptional regulator with XRE-family HTH domain
MAVASPAPPALSRLAQARRASGLTQADVARELGLSLFRVEQLESGRIDAHPYIGPYSQLTGQPPGYFLVAPRTAPAALLEEEQPLEGNRGEADPDEVIPRRLLVLGMLTLLIVIRLFSETFRILPKAITFIDIPVFVFILLVAATVRSWQKDPAPLRFISGLTAAFTALVLISILTNLGRIEAFPAGTFLYMFAAPMALAVAIYRIWPAGNAPLVTQWLFGIGLLQLFIVLTVNLPDFLATRNPDVISGTFGENGYQLAIFLAVVISALAGLLAYDSRRPLAKFAIPGMLAFTAVILLVQYRTLLLTLAAVALLIAYFLRKQRRGLLYGAVFTVLLFGVFSLVSSYFTELKYDQATTELSNNPGVFVDARLNVAKDVVGVYTDDPRYILTGTGPGTFSSRAWRTFGVVENKRKSVVGGFARRLTGGDYRTDVSEKWTIPSIKNAPVIGGSVQISQPYMSYTAVAAEAGMGGLLLIVSIYFIALGWTAKMANKAIRLSSRSDPLVPVCLAACVGIFTLIQLGALENWLEVTRITFFCWALVAIAAKEMEDRHPTS